MTIEIWTYSAGNQSASVALDELGLIHTTWLGDTTSEPGYDGTRAILYRITIRVDAADIAERLLALEILRKASAESSKHAVKRAEARRLLREYGFTQQPEAF